jgi:hypothetical protein
VKEQLALRFMIQTHEFSTLPSWGKGCENAQARWELLEETSAGVGARQAGEIRKSAGLGFG